MKSSERSVPTLKALRSAFAKGCKICGVSQETCLNLMLLLQSREELATMVLWMLREEDAGRHPDTTEVVLKAEEVKEMAEAHPELINRKYPGE